MSAIQDTIYSIRLLASKLDGLNHLAGTLEGIGDLEQRLSDLNARIASAQKAETDAQLAAQAAVRQADECVKDLQRAKSQASQITEQAGLDAQRVRDQAQQDAEKVVESAKATARSVVSEAQDRASALVADAKARAADSDTLAVSKARQAAESQARIESATQELEAITGRISAAKARIAEVLKFGSE
jgi:cell division septum initiation protein DivIVA